MGSNIFNMERRSKVRMAAERGEALVRSYDPEPERVDIVMILADLDAWLAANNRLNIKTLGELAHQIHLRRVADDKIWERT